MCRRAFGPSTPLAIFLAQFDRRSGTVLPWTQLRVSWPQRSWSAPGLGWRVREPRPALTPTTLPGRLWDITGAPASRLTRHGDPNGIRPPATTRTIATGTARFITATTGDPAPSKRGPRFRTHGREFGPRIGPRIALCVAALPKLGSVMRIADQEQAIRRLGDVVLRVVAARRVLFFDTGHRG